MRTFSVVRYEDVSGVSGTGIVAEGVEFHDKQVVISWFGQKHSLDITPDIETWLSIHGHNGRTIIEWHDTDDLSAPPSLTRIRCLGCRTLIFCSNLRDRILALTGYL